jgi:hypothetical protein
LGNSVATCTLEVGERVVLRSKGGPPEAEYALFDAGDIILSATGPGQVREHGYHATAADALGRLESAGVHLDLAREAAAAVAASLAVSYARGPAVRRVAQHLGPAELFDGGAYDAELRRYEGRWLDLPGLALDVEISRATTLMQAFSLVARLHEVDPQTPVVLSTREYSAERRPGERSYRRVPLENATNLPHAFRSLAARLASSRGQTPPSERANGPTREELILSLHERAEAASNEEARARILAIEVALSPRPRPTRGPLSDADLWILEEQLSTGNAVGVIERLEAIEKKLGRSPATSYLRARVSLVTGREPARIIAERAGALAMSMTSFTECELLAAEAWSAAGELRRAVPFARDLVANTSTHDDIRARAAQIVEAAERSRSKAPPPPSTLPPPPAEDSEPVLLLQRPPRSISDELKIDDPYSYPPEALRPSARPTFGPLDPSSLGPRRNTSPMANYGEIEGPPSTPAPPVNTPPPGPSPRPPSTQTLAAPPESRHDLHASAIARGSETMRAIPKPPRSWRPSGPVVPAGFTPPPYVAPPHVSEPTGSPSSASMRAARASAAMMPGASQPPFRSDSPGAHAHIPKAPSMPAGHENELVATLSLPPGLAGVPAPYDTLPGSVLDARVQFTYRSRELAREYEEDLGIVLRVDLASIEAMQAVLLERYPERTVATAEQKLDVQKHGALLSEILARTFRGFWVDIAPSDLGYWAMVVPPDTRVWPFGRILRLIAMQHKERDLVAYYLEIQARAR